MVGLAFQTLASYGGLASPSNPDLSASVIIHLIIPLLHRAPGDVYRSRNCFLQAKLALNAATIIYNQESIAQNTSAYK